MSVDLHSIAFYYNKLNWAEIFDADGKGKERKKTSCATGNKDGAAFHGSKCSITGKPIAHTSRQDMHHDP